MASSGWCRRDALLVQQLAQLCALFIRTSDQYCHNTLNQCEISNQSMRADIGLPLFVVTVETLQDLFGSLAKQLLSQRDAKLLSLCARSANFAAHDLRTIGFTHKSA